MSTAYRYVLALEEVGLVAASGGGYYILGPAILQLDRQIQLTDPLLLSARPVMNRLIDEMKKAIASPDVGERLARAGLEAQYASVEAFTDGVRRDLDRFGKLVKTLGIPPQ